MNTDEIRAALAAATPGPWDATYDPSDRWTSITGQQYGEYVCPEVATCEGGVGTDAHLIANAPTWLAELLAEVDLWTSVLPCEVTHEEPFDFDQCTTHDRTFPRGGTCDHAGASEVDWLQDREAQQRVRALRAEARAEAAEQAVHRVRGMAEAWATQPNDYDEDTEQQIEDGNAILRALDGGEQHG